MVRRTAHPARPDQPLGGGPQMVELSRDGRRIYVTNGLFSPVDAQFYPGGFDGWVVKAELQRGGGLALDRNFLVMLEDGMRPHQVRLQGGDASSDSFCYAA
jgi:selenium-binding protein 1